MMTKRSHHMPTLTRIDAIHITGRFVRAASHQKICDDDELQNSIRPEDAARRPVAAVHEPNHSYGVAASTRR